jgi:hypothetical protein
MDSIFQGYPPCKLIPSNFPSPLGERVRVRGIGLREKISKNVEACEDNRQRLRKNSGQYCEIANWPEENSEGNSLSADIYWIFILLSISSE